MAAIEAVRADPAGAVRHAQEKVRSGDDPLRFIPDMPGPEGGASKALDDEELEHLVMAPLDSLAHDAAFFDRIDRDAAEHAQILRRVRERFAR